MENLPLLPPPASGYPDHPSERNRWIHGLRGPRRTLDPSRPYAWLSEEEPGPDGRPWTISTLFLTNRECPFRCLMCDLWQDTLESTVPIGAIPRQIQHALAQLPPARAVKLYNAGSFFDPAAIPEIDYPHVAHRVKGFERVIVESHTAFLGERTLRLRDLIRPAKLEVAIGLETVHPEVLDRLNKRMTLMQFRSAATFLRSNDIDLRVFVLLRPPFLTECEGFQWACKTLDFAFDAGATLCSVIPVRAGNGAMDVLQRAGDFTPPRLATLELAMRYGLSLGKGRVLGDLWDIDPALEEHGDDARRESIRLMNQTQKVV